jgi:hypothetical protein
MAYPSDLVVKRWILPKLKVELAGHFVCFCRAVTLSFLSSVFVQALHNKPALAITGRSVQRLTY